MQIVTIPVRAPRPLPRGPVLAHQGAAMVVPADALARAIERAERRRPGDRR